MIIRTSKALKHYNILNNVIQEENIVIKENNNKKKNKKPIHVPVVEKTPDIEEEIKKEDDIDLGELFKEENIDE